MDKPKAKRAIWALYGGVAGSIAAAAVLPPEVVQWIAVECCGKTLPPQVASWVGNIVAGLTAGLGAHVAPTQTEGA